MLRKLLLVATLALPAAAFAEDRTFTIEGGQVSVPVGLTVQVKAVIGLAMRRYVADCAAGCHGVPCGRVARPHGYLCEEESLS